MIIFNYPIGLGPSDDVIAIGTTGRTRDYTNYQDFKTFSCFKIISIHVQKTCIQ